MKSTNSLPKVQAGIDILLEEKAKILQGRNVGLLAHPASVTYDLRHTVGELASQPGIKLCALFGPEHGIGGEYQDQEEAREEAYGDITVPVYSLYKAESDSLRPSQEIVKGIDVFVIDLQDIGIRYYTFIYTLSYCMEVCRDAGVEVVVLDRPNPLGGETLEGNLVEEGFHSFVGRYPIPVRHGMTIGELARMFNEAFGIGCSLRVIPMKGWKRWMWYDHTGLPWVMPSPNMPTLDTATVYGGSCLFEGTNISEGRGTTRPFETLGAPWVEPERFCQRMNTMELPGVRFRPCRFSPFFHKWARRPCGGVQIHVTDRQKFQPFLTGIHLLQSIYQCWPGEFSWRKGPYEFEAERLAIDLLAGGKWLREAVERDISLDRFYLDWKESLDTFGNIRKKYLLY
jgi:uncharacterized protein YbbC (DUF1343 family)